MVTREGFRDWLSAPVAARFGAGSGAGRPSRWPGLPAVALLVYAALLALQMLSTERYLHNDGLGDDGTFYAEWVRRFDWHLPNMGLHAYSAQRVVGVGLVRLLLDATHSPLTNPNIVRAFQYVNYACVVIAFFAWGRASRHLRLTRAGYLVGATALFVNFATLKWIPFDPVLTDAEGFALGCGALALWLGRHHVPLILLSAIGAFVWPSFGYVGCLLVALPRPAREGEPLGPPGIFPNAIAAVAAATWATAAHGLADFQPMFGVPPASRSVFGLSCAVVALALFFALRRLARPSLLLAQVRRGSIASTALSLGAGLLLYAGIRWAIGWASSNAGWGMPQPPFISTQVFIQNTLFLSVQRPGTFLVGHAVFFGPWVVLLALRWRDVTDAAARLGAGSVAVLGLAILMGMNNEGRRMLGIMPVVLAPVLLGLARARWTLERLGQLLVLTLLASKVWYTVVQSPIPDAETMTSSIGPWMILEHYQAQLAACGVIAIWAWFAWRDERGPFVELAVALEVEPEVPS
jgi:hypothetical protein